jgi:hypothetical protein
MSAQMSGFTVVVISEVVVGVCNEDDEVVL